MIYNWSRVTDDVLAAKELTPEDLAVHKDLKIAEGQYLLVQANNDVLLDRSDSQFPKYVHPSYGDLFVRGDKTYGLEKILTSKKIGNVWSFSLIVRELKKEQFSAPKAKARAAG